MLHTRKHPRRSFSLRDQVNKSDSEDKSLSNDETPLPSCPRQPPDGVEAPFDVVEKLPLLPTRLPPRLTSGWLTTTRTRFSYSSRTQDARSEASIKDKIAMFSNDVKINSFTLKSAMCQNYTRNNILSLDHRLTKSQDSLDEVSTRKEIYKNILEHRAIQKAGINCENNFVHNITAESRFNIVSKPLFYESTNTLSSGIEALLSANSYHYISSSNNNNDDNILRKSNLKNLIEQRKKSMSKLRGLVIPEMQPQVVDLPEIKTKDLLSDSFIRKANVKQSVNKNENKCIKPKPIDFNEFKWKTNFTSNNVPKYSPAFKRKALEIYSPSCLSKESTSEPETNDKIDLVATYNKNSIMDKFVKSSLAYKNFSSTLNLKQQPTNYLKLGRREYKHDIHTTDQKSNLNLDVKICTVTDVIDSDNDSAMSSKQSSYRSSASSPLHNLDSIEPDSSRISPKVSGYLSYSVNKNTSLNKKNTVFILNNIPKRNLTWSASSNTNVSVSSSAASAATSGSQASCSSIESPVVEANKKKILKSYNIDTVIRRNIVASAKCRSGRDEKLKSPVIESEFIHESPNRSSITQQNSNKGDQRRINKLVAETDSDSEDDMNLRQNTEYKNTRLKRNISSGNKSKGEVTLNYSKTIQNDGPKATSEKNMEKINKAGLDYFKSLKNDLNKKEANYKEAYKTEFVVVSERVAKNDTNSCIYHKCQIVEASTEISSEKCVLSSHIVRLQRGSASSLGVILAGGVDCEAKEVTVHRVLADSVAARAGLKRGVRVRSINGLPMTGLTHAQSVAVLKEQRAEVVVEIESNTEDFGNKKDYDSENAKSKLRNNADKVDYVADGKTRSIVTVVLEKAGGGAGLGFGLDGGRDSPIGDVPLTIKKLFAGGAAAQSGKVLEGAELLSAGDQSFEGFTRTQAWAALKTLPPGPVTLVLKNPK